METKWILKNLFWVQWGWVMLQIDPLGTINEGKGYEGLCFFIGELSRPSHSPCKARSWPRAFVLPVKHSPTFYGANKLLLCTLFKIKISEIRSQTNYVKKIWCRKWKKIFGYWKIYVPIELLFELNESSIGCSYSACLETSQAEPSLNLDSTCLVMWMCPSQDFSKSSPRCARATRLIEKLQVHTSSWHNNRGGILWIPQMLSYSKL